MTSAPAVRHDPVREQARLTATRRVLPAVILAHACLLPRELTFEVSGAALFPYRLILFLLIPVLLTRLAQNPPRISAVDFFATFVSAWYVVSLLMTETGVIALVTGVALAADFGLAYLVGRTSVRNSEDFRRFLALMLPALLLVALVLMVESLSHTILLRPAIATLAGLPAPNVPLEIRSGLGRAYGPFPHPILAGVFLASVLPIAWYAARHGRQRLLAFIVAGSAVFTMSAGALLSFVIGGLLIALNQVQRFTRLPMFLIAFAYGIGGAILVSIVSQSGLTSFVFRYLTLNPASGYYRSQIWEYAGIEAMNHPVFGIGLRDWARPSWMPSNSIDAHWLLLSMMYGMPLAIASFLVVAGSVTSVLRANRRGSRQDRDTSMGLAFALVIITFAGFTVALWEGLSAWLVMLCGMAMSVRPIAGKGGARR